MTAKNEAIGKVECPAKGCTLEIPVFRFRPRPAQKMQRFANKLYCRCPKHGQFGGAAGDDDMQAYIEENAIKCEPQPDAPATPAVQPEKPAPAKPTPAAKAPATRPAAPTAAQPATPARKGLLGLDW